MQPFRVIAIPKEIADSVRANRLAPGYGHPVHAEVASGHGPCRLCLRDFAVGKEDLPLPGPIFIHERACERYPERGGMPADSRRHGLTLNAYGRGRRLLAQEYVRDGAVESVAARLLAVRDVDYIHVRDTHAGCFDFAVER